MGFQQFFSIVDGDVDRLESDPTDGARLFKLPVYHVENFLLDDADVLDATSNTLGARCPYSTAQDVENELKGLLLSDGHLKPYTRALLAARTAKSLKEVCDAWARGGTTGAQLPAVPDFSRIEGDARRRLESAIAEDTWRAECKGRSLLRAYCGKHSLNYEHFRNLLIAKMREKEPPAALAEIMGRILST